MTFEETIRATVREELLHVLRDELPGILREMQATRPKTLYLNATQAAEHAGVDRNTIYVWVKEGKLPALRAGSRLRIRQSDLDAFMAREAEAPKVTDDELEARAFALVNGR